MTIGEYAPLGAVVLYLAWHRIYAVGRLKQFKESLTIAVVEKERAIRHAATLQSIIDRDRADLAARRLRFKDADVTDTDNQRRFVNCAQFKRKSLIGFEERYVYEAALAAIRGTGFRIDCQVSMGEFIGTEDALAFSSINAKRSDFLISDEAFMPVMVIEHQGSGHDQGNAPQRDEIKRIVLEKSGIELLETTKNVIAPGITEAVREKLQRAATPLPPPA